MQLSCRGQNYEIYNKLGIVLTLFPTGHFPHQNYCTINIEPVYYKINDVVQYLLPCDAKPQIHRAKTRFLKTAIATKPEVSESPGIKPSPISADTFVKGSVSRQVRPMLLYIIRKVSL